VIRRLTDLDLHEVSIAAVPAYQDTSVAVRAFNRRHYTLPRLRALHRFLATT
jgi:phage head maturation protease